jgi:hypothetical protein
VENLDGFKICSKCKEELPLENFGKHKSERDGYASRCKKCNHENYLMKSPNRKHAEEKYIPKEGFKVCSKCKIEKPINKFVKNDGLKDGLSRRCKDCDKEHRDAHKEQRKKAFKKWCDDNPDYRSEYNKKYREKNRDYLIERCRQYYYENQETLTEKKRNYASERRDEINEWQREYRKTPQGKINDMVAGQKRRDRERNLPSTLNVRQWLKVLEMQDYMCPGCGRRFGDGLKPTQDHIIPLTNIWCYGLTFGNTKALCVSCNSKKHNTFKLGKAIDTLLVKL